MPASVGLSALSFRAHAAELGSLMRFLFPRALATSHFGKGCLRRPEGRTPKSRSELLRPKFGCYRKAATGKTASVGGDFGVMLPLASQWFRSAVVARLRLEDLDWRAVEILVTGESGTVADYFRTARPTVRSNAMFATRVSLPRQSGHQRSARNLVTVPDCGPASSDRTKLPPGNAPMDSDEIFTGSRCGCSDRARHPHRRA